MADARTIIQALVAMPVEDGVTVEQGNEIARLFEGDFTLFVELDESPGRYTSPDYHGQEGVYSYDSWHWKLRQARNDCDNQFFDILAGRDAA